MYVIILQKINPLEKGLVQIIHKFYYRGSIAQKHLESDKIFEY